MNFRPLLSFIISVLFFTTASAADKKIYSVFLCPFSSGNQQSQWIAAALNDSAQSDLSRIQSINVITDENKLLAANEASRAGILSGKDDQKILAGLTGADIIVKAKCRTSEKEVMITIWIYGNKTGEIISTAELKGSVSSIKNLETNICEFIINSIKQAAENDYTYPNISEKDRVRIEAKSNPKPDAYEKYGQALSIMNVNPSEALALCDKAIEDQPDYYEAIILAAAIENNRGNTSIALARIERAKAVMKKNKNENDITTAFMEMNKAPILLARGRLAEALESYGNAKKIFERESMTSSLLYIAVLQAISDIKRFSGENENAASLSKQAASIYEKISMTRSCMYAWSLLVSAEDILSLKNYGAALNVFQKSSDTFSSCNLGMSKGAVLSEAQKALCNYRLDNFDAALKGFSSALKNAAALKIDNDENFAWFYRYTATILFEKKMDPESALPFMKKSVEIFTKAKSVELDGAKEYLSKIEKSTGK